MEGTPVYEKKEKFIDFEWGGAAPIDLLTPGKFSIRYSGILKPDFTGEISLNVLESGGSYKLIIDNQEIILDSSSKEAVNSSKVLNVNKNNEYHFKLEYKCNNPWMASIQLLWNLEHLQGKNYMIQKVKESDVVVYVGGITARLEGEEMPVEIEGFEKGDRTNLKLPKVQHELLKELHKLGKPIVFVLTSGSAMAIKWEQENLPAILGVWYPGQAGGEAVTDILFGEYNPSGKLPITFYKSIEDLPPFEDYHMKGRTYRYFNGDVLYPFGYGLSFTNFSYSKPKLGKLLMSKKDTNTVEVTVANVGNFDGETVVQLYVNDKEASVTTPLKSLKGFKKIFLKKGASKTVQFELSAANLSIIDYEGNSFLEPGVFEIFVGESSATSNKAVLTVR